MLSNMGLTAVGNGHMKLECTVSEPTSRYKTELCRPFEENGTCKYGDKCQFAHGYWELRNLTRHPKYKTELCRTFHKVGFCPYGPRCHFVHNFEEARANGLKLSSPGAQTPTLGTMASPPTDVGALLLEQLNPRLNPALSQLHRPLMRTTSLGHQPLIMPLTQRSSSITLSPAFSMGSSTESSSPTSSLSQSPTNSMASFFNDYSNQSGFGRDFITMPPRQSPPPIINREESVPRTPSPVSPCTKARLSVFNKISNTQEAFEALKI